MDESAVRRDGRWEEETEREREEKDSVSIWLNKPPLSSWNVRVRVVIGIVIHIFSVYAEPSVIFIMLRDAI